MSKYTSLNPPESWRNTHDLTRFDRDPDYARDEFARSNWPEGGLIDDVWAHSLGFESTNLFAFWSAVAGVTSLVQRDAHLRFGTNLYANFYIIFTAPPGILRKSTVMSLMDDAERTMYDNLDESPLKMKKEVKNVIRGKATSESMFEAMKNRPIELPEAGTQAESDAVLIIRASELGTLLSKAQYNVQLIDKLTDFYDCKKRDTDTTLGRGNNELRNIFATLFGCTTPDSLKDTIPKEAFGGGFMSRCTIVNQYPRDAHRIIPMPYFNDDCPNHEELAERMQWIMENKHGEYVLEPAALTAYNKWYREETMRLRASAEGGFEDHRNNRKTIQVLKLALTFALQRYDTSKYITLDDFEKAVTIIEYTLEHATELVQDIAMAGNEDGGMFRFIRLIQGAGLEGISRKNLGKINNFKSYEINKYLTEMVARDIGFEARVKTGVKTEKGKDQTEKRIFYGPKPKGGK